MSSSRTAARYLRRALVCCAALLAACAGDTEQVRILHFWAMGSEAEAVRQLLPEFERLHPDIRVEVQQLAWTAAHEKLLTAFAGDSTPDVCQLGNTWIPEFATLGALEPLDQRLAATTGVLRQDYFDGIWNTNVIDDTTWGVPWYVDTRLLFFRRDLLAAAGYDRPPVTWNEWREMMEAVTRAGGKDRYALLLPLNEFEPLLVLALQQPEPLLRDDGRYGNFRSDSFRRALEFYRSVFESGLAPPLTSSEISNVWAEFGRGYFTFYLSGPWNVGEFSRRLPADFAASWTTAPMPGPDGPGASTAGGSSLVVFRRSPRKDTAWALIEFLSRPGTQRRLYALTGDLPPRRSSWQTPELEGDSRLDAFRQQLERVRPVPPVPEWERIMEEMRLMAERVVHGTQTVSDGTAELDARVDQLLAKRRWLLDREDGR